MLIGKYSSSAHELLLQFLFGRSRLLVLLVVLVVLRAADELLHRCRGKPTLDLEGPGKGSTTDGELQTLGRGMQVRPSTGCSSRRIGEDLEARSPVTGDDAQQLSSLGTLPAPHTRADTASDFVGGHGSARAFW
jgi:hypothetical protein